MYFIQKNLTRLEHNQSTLFLDPKELSQVQRKFKKSKYSIYYPYKDSEKNIIYVKEIPEVCLYEIQVKIPVRHQDILGAMYSLNIAPELFGDILIIHNFSKTLNNLENSINKNKVTNKKDEILTEVYL